MGKITNINNIMECGLEQIVVENIRKIRKKNGISQEKLAELSSTSTSYICSMENHKYPPKLSTIERIAAALGVSAWTLFNPHRDEYIKSSNLGMMSKREVRNRIVAAIDEILFA